MANTRTRERGFGLIQMALVLMVLGVILSTLVSVFVGRVQKDMAKRALTAIRLTRDEIIGFTIVNRRLPAGDATAKITESGFTLSSPTDPWGNTWRYIAARTSACTGNLYDTGVYINSQSNTGLSVTAYGTTTSDVAFVLVSPGPNGSLETTLPAAINPTTCPGTFTVLGLGAAGAGSIANDDVVEYVVLGHIHSKM